MSESATMESGCRYLSFLRSCDLATAISRRMVTEEMLERCAQEGRIDVRNKEGQTPLMLACLTGLEDVVKFLLANGANPNSNSLMMGNTPLHFACMVEDIVEEEYLSRTFYKPKKWTTTKVSIVKLLLKYGASVQKNLDGWNPACVAAFYNFKDIVDFFLLIDDGSPLEDKITASQILGVSQATLDEPALKDAFHSFCRALDLQEDAGVITGQAETSELVLCFSKLSLTEFHTLEEIKAVELSESALKAHAFLVGERLFPPSLKQRYLYPSLTHFASLLMYHEDMVEAGFQIFSCTLGFERSGELQLGTVLGHIASNYEFFCVHDGKKEVRQRARDLLCAYGSVVNNVPIDSLLGRVCRSLMGSFGDILFSEAFSCFSFDDLKSTLEDVEKLLKFIRGRTFRERQDEYPRMPSVALKIMTLLQDKFEETVECVDTVIDRRYLLKVKFVFLRVLLCDKASYQDVNNRNTLLHMVAYSTYAERYLECIQDLALAFLRHGCPLDAVNRVGDTARDLMRLLHGRFGNPNIYLIQTLVNPPTSVLRLEEAAARVVLRHKINYQDVLPLRLRELVDGGTAELELELLKLLKTNEDSSEDSGEDNE
ncbi:protein fem-1 homolog C [Strongylocentrotus purpuratus]|uniref:Uncharacterized protein n=1 Tax=Strongylocentrotus purpuratus TaxID=7668 RepID=A0A7M7HQ42_STRPU|nr:protein fem-1 homolog C [Strongylocentrotus purpuratus]|eukprot:XP_011682941.1 PREDICTED: protein fem-1 homolog C-like isoform X3 [Strongylocentrotus purpuratus]